MKDAGVFNVIGSGGTGEWIYRCAVQQRRDKSDQWRVAAGELPDEQMQQNNNKTILSNDNNNNSWTGCLIISTTMLLFLYVPGIRMSA